MKVFSTYEEFKYWAFLYMGISGKLNDRVEIKIGDVSYNNLREVFCAHEEKIRNGQYVLSNYFFPIAFL